MLNDLAKKDKLWRQIAFNICGCKMQSDDIVQEMYLRFYRNPKETVNDYYVALVIKSVYLNSLTKTKNVSIENLHYLEDKTNDFEVNDNEKDLLESINELSWVQKELLAESFDRSYREIERVYNINYGYAYQQVKKAKKIILNGQTKKK